MFCRSLSHSTVTWGNLLVALLFPILSTGRPVLIPSLPRAIAFCRIWSGPRSAWPCQRLQLAPSLQWPGSVSTHKTVSPSAAISTEQGEVYPGLGQSSGCRCSRRWPLVWLSAEVSSTGATDHTREEAGTHASP